MATLRKRGDTWQLNYSYGGRRVQRSLGTNERLARLRLAELEAAQERGAAGFTVEVEPRLGERIDRWLLEHRANLAPSTYLRCTQYAGVAARIIGRDKVVTPGALERFKAARLEEGVKAKTVNNELAWIKQVHGAGGEHHFKMVKKLKVRDAREVRWLTSDEVQRLLAAAPRHAVPYLEGYLLTGARRGELVALRWSDWDRRLGTLRLPNLKTAGRRPGDSHRVIPVHPRLAVILEERLAAGLGSPFPPPQDAHRMRTWVVKAARRAKIEPTPTLHDLRHTFASHLVQAGTPLLTVGALLGHTNPTTTMIYAHLAPSTLAGAIRVLDYGTAATPSTPTSRRP